MINYNEEYDKTSPVSIEQYAQKLIGRTFREIIESDAARNSLILRESTGSYEQVEEYDQKKNKGNLGQIIEEKFFHYACNNDRRADFHEAGVELKVTPYKINPNGKFVAKERLILTMIDYYTILK